jgi:MFS transporter, DHA1 family, inner membrane transport protein
MAQESLGEGPLPITAERRLLWLLAAMQFVNIVDFMLIMPLGPVYIKALKLTPDQFGGVVAAYGYAAGLMGLLAGLFIDRFPRRASLAAVFAGLLVGTLACGFATDHRTLMGGRILAGMFGGMLGGLVLAVIGDVIPPHRRGAATGQVMGAFAVASVVGVPLGMVLAERGGPQTAFFALALVSLPMLPLVFWLVPSTLRPTRLLGNPVRQLWLTLSEPNHLKAFALMTLMMLSGFSMIPFLAVYMRDHVGLRQDQIKYIYLVGGLATMVSMPLLGRLSDQVGALPLFRLMATLAMLAMVVVTNLPPVPLWLALTVTTGFMVALSGRGVPAMTMIIGSASPDRRGSFSTANSAVQHVTSGIAVTLGAWIGGAIEHADPSLAEGAAAETVMTIARYDVVGWFCVAASVAALVVAGWLPKPRPLTMPDKVVAVAHVADPIPEPA